MVSRSKDSTARIAALAKDADKTAALLKQAEVAPQGFAEQRGKLLDTLSAAEQRKQAASDAMVTADTAAGDADRASRAADAAAAQAREARAGLAARSDRQPIVVAVPWRSAGAEIARTSSCRRR